MYRSVTALCFWWGISWLPVLLLAYACPGWCASLPRHDTLTWLQSHGTETRRGSKRTEAGEGGEDAGKKSATDDDDDGEDGDEDESDDAIDEGMVVEEAEEEE